MYGWGVVGWWEGLFVCVKVVVVVVFCVCVRLFYFVCVDNVAIVCMVGLE